MNNSPGSIPENLQFPCPSCGSTLQVPVSKRGKQAKCPQCSGVVSIPADGQATPKATPKAPVAPPALTPTAAGAVAAIAQPTIAPRATTETSGLYQQIRDEVAKVFVGQEDLVEGTLIAIFSGGHVLIESVPGLGKTLFVRTLGKILGCDFGRIQFTADLMPSDITGAPIFNMKTQRGLWLEVFDPYSAAIRHH